MPFSSRAWRRLAGGAALALLAAALAPAHARAECGDYVMFGGKHVSSMPNGHSASDGQAPAIPCPCKGPGCSKAPTQPLVPPAPPPSVSTGEWACLLAVSGSPRISGSGTICTQRPDRPIYRTNPIFHPPRIG